MVKYILAIFILLNLLIILFGKSWIYNGIYNTYLKGHTSAYIDDFIHFPSNVIKTGEHQKWALSENYNKKTTPDFLSKINDSLETVAFMIIVNDSIQFEKYWDGYSSDTMSNSFSISKSWVSTLIGIALKEGKINSLDQKVCDFLPEFCNKRNAELTIENLLSMSSGLNWKEEYYNPIGQTAEAYYGNNLRGLIYELSVVESPGKVFRYHSSCTQLLAFILESATGQKLSSYLSEKLWQPMGAKNSALWNTDVKGGTEKGFCCINSNARDFARLGRLYLNQGNWNGVQIIDTNYVISSTSATKLLNEKGFSNTNYGYHFWIAERRGLKVYYSRGLWGQYVICIPEKKMIIVRLGRKYGEKLQDGHRTDLYKYIDAALEMQM